MPIGQIHAQRAASQPCGGVTAAGVRHACVVGGGLAGLACSIAAAMCGVRVDLFDREPTLASAPAFVEIVPNMLRDMVGLGVADDCVRAGFAYHGLDVFDRQGRLRLEIPSQRLVGLGYPVLLGIEHDELLRILDRCARAHGVRVHRGCEVVGVERPGDVTALRLATGDVITSDLVILAGGAGSPLLTTVFPHAKRMPDLGAITQVWWYALMPRPLALQRATLYVGGAGRKVMMVPVRGDLAGFALIEPVAHAVGVTDSTPAAHVRTALLQFPAQVQAIASQLRNDTPVARRPVFSALMPPPWHCGPVMVVGSAAHAMPPHFGQAGAQALEDACVLSELLSTTRNGCELARGFTDRRFARSQQVHEIALTAARWDLAPDTTTDLRELTERLSRLVAVPP